MIKPVLHAIHSYAICGYAMDLFEDYGTYIERAVDEAISDSIIDVGLLLVDGASVEFLALRDIAVFSRRHTSCI